LLRSGYLVVWGMWPYVEPGPMWDRLADRQESKSKGIAMLIGNDRKRLNLDLDLERRGVAMPRPLDLAELEAVEGGVPAAVVLAAGAAMALTSVVVGAAVGAAVGVAVGVAISQ
jgi:hypothetical protein